MPRKYYRYYIWPEFQFLEYAWRSIPHQFGVHVKFCIGNTDDGWHGRNQISDELQTDFATWMTEIRDELSACNNDCNSVNWNRFHAKGEQLGIKLKRELGKDSDVYYVKPTEDPNPCSRFLGVMADGTMTANSTITKECLKMMSMKCSIFRANDYILCYHHYAQITPTENGCMSECKCKFNIPNCPIETKWGKIKEILGVWKLNQLIGHL